METQIQKTFDATAQNIRIVVISGSEKKAIVAFPNDQQWCARAKQHRLTRRQVGGGASRLDSLDTERIDKQLFDSIRQDRDGVEFDEFEAAEAVSRLEAVEVIDTVRDGNQYTITIESLGKRLVHAVRIPTKRDTADFHRDSVDVTDSRAGRVIGIRLEPSATLYDKLQVSADGYASHVPIIHKTTVVSALISAIDEASQAVNSDFFG